MVQHQACGPVTADLSHLARQIYQVRIVLRGGHGKVIPVEVSYSSHCYSRGLSPGEIIPADQLIVDGSLETPRNRIFHPERYALSKKLPDLLAAMFVGADRVFSTRHHNHVRVELLDGDKKYYIFLSMRKHKSATGPKMIKLYVESAYPEDALYDKPHMVKPFSLKGLLAKCWEERHGSP